MELGCPRVILRGLGSEWEGARALFTNLPKLGHQPFTSRTCRSGQTPPIAVVRPTQRKIRTRCKVRHGSERGKMEGSTATMKEQA